MSKFEWSSFWGDCYDHFAVSKEKYTKEEAIKIYAREYALEQGTVIAIGHGWAKHRAGINDDNEPVVGWWLEYEDRGRNCLAWIFHTHRGECENTLWEKDYEFYTLTKEDVS